MTLRLKLTFGVTLVIVATMTVTTLAVSRLVMRQNDENAQDLMLRQTRQVRQELDRLAQGTSGPARRFAQAPETVAALKSLGSFHGHRNIGVYAPDLDRPKEEMAQRLGRMVRAGEADSLEVFDPDGRLVVSAVLREGGLVLGIQSFGRDDQPVFRYRSPPTEGDEPGRWEEGPPPPGHPDAVLPVRQASRVWFSAVQDGLSLLAMEPVFRPTGDPDDVGPRLGTVLARRFQGQPFVLALAQGVGLEVSLFAGDRFVAGTAQGARHLDPAGLSTPFRAPDRLSIRTVIHGGEEYYQNVVPLEGLDGPAGALALCLPRQGARDKTRENILVLLAIMGLSIAGAVPVTILMAGFPTRRIRAILLAVQSITGGRLSERAPVDSRDELGDLASAFNRMAGDLQTLLGQYQESLDQYQVLFDYAPDGICISSPGGAILSCNQAFVSIFRLEGLDIREVSTISLYRNPEDRDRLLSLMEAHGQVENHEVEVRDPQGRVFMVSMSSRRISYQGRPAFQTMLRDITRRKQAEESLRKAHDDLERRVETRTQELKKMNERLLQAKEAADAATRTKSEFLANMSHEIRTPLNGVIAATDLALAGDHSPGIARFLNIIHSSAHSLLGIINDILDFSKIEAGKLDLDIRSFELTQVLGAVAEVFESRAAEKRIEFLIDMAWDIPALLMGDPLRLKQVLVNLVGNAFKFTTQGVILLSVEKTGLTGGEADLLFKVRDTGIGIPAERQARLFDPFIQADSSTTRRFGGTGLGLAICRNLCQLMGGGIWVDSEEGRGSTFSFSVRLGVASETPAAGFELPEELSRSPALVVDDTPESLDITRRMLESFGLAVQVAASGQEALDRLASQDFGLVVTDWLMPGLTGIEMTRRLRQDLGLKTPVIMMTAFGQEQERQEAGRAGVNGFLSKPLSQSSLFDAVMEAHGRREPGRPGKDPTQAPESAWRTGLKGLRILVAEDNPTNQEIALAVLQGAGLAAEIAETGRAAVQMLREREFDAVLMDIQMPELDGLEATRIIRQDPRFQDLPIIAMTAHAMKGDEEKCIAAGMNAYVSKPIDRTRLLATLHQWLGLHGAAPRVPEPPPPGADTPETRAGNSHRLDQVSAMARLGLSPEGYVRIVAGFARQNQDTVRTLRDSLQAGDLEALARQAHSLKGSSGNIGAEALWQAALDLENAARQAREPEVLAGLLGVLEPRLRDVLQGIGELTQAAGTQTARTGPGLTPEQTRTLAARLAEALRQSDPVGAEQALNALAGGLPDHDFQGLAGLVGDYDFEAALKALERFMARLGMPEAGEGLGRASAEGHVPE